MAEWEVTLPVVGIAYVTVVADSAEAAIDAALDECDSEHLQEWSAVRYVSQGNVCYAPQNRATAERVTDDD